MRRLVGGRFAGWNVLNFPKNRLKNAKRYGYSFEVLAGILIFSSIYRLGTKIVTGKKKQSDTKVNLDSSRLHLGDSSEISYAKNLNCYNY